MAHNSGKFGVRHQLKTAVQFGAGNIGRGFTGELFSESGLEVVFVDVVEEVVQRLNQDNGYIITIAAEPEVRVPVTNVRAVNGRDVNAVAQEIAACEVACTAVGVNVLSSIVGALAMGLELRRSLRPNDALNIIVCENMRDAAGALCKMVSSKLSGIAREWVESHVGFSQAVVGRMVPVRTPQERGTDLLGIRVEAYKELPVDADALVGALPYIAGVLPRRNFQAYIDQKLFAHNAGHASSAYFGAMRELKFIWECMVHPWVRAQTEGVMKETGEALISRYKLDPEEHWAHVKDLLSRFANKKLGDTVARVGGDPLRKLGHDDRLVGAALFCLEEGVEPVYISEAIAAALIFNNSEDPAADALQTKIGQHGISAAFQEISGVSPDSDLGRRVMNAYKKFQNPVNRGGCTNARNDR